MIDVDTIDFDDDDDFLDDEPPRRRRRVWPVALALVVLAGLGTAAWWGYTTQFQPVTDEVMPLIKADAGPIKARPADPGGMEVPYQDKLVLNDVTPEPNQPQVERLLPPPEVPQPPAPQSSDTAAATPTQSASDLAPAASTAGISPAAPSTAPAKPVVPAPPSQAAQAPAPAAKAPAVPPPATVAAATQAAPVQTASRGSYMIQVASLKDRSLVDGEWTRLQDAFGDVLVGKELVVQTVDLGSRGTFHRVRAGYFADHDSAAAVCQKLEAKKQACIVVKQ